MTRLEIENSSNNNQLNQMEDELDRLKRQLKHKQSKKIINCRSCSLLILLIIIGLGAILAAVLAKSGLYQIPFFTANFYHQPVPIYEVKVDDYGGNDFLAELEQLIKLQALKQQKVSDLKIDMSLTESELSGLLLEQFKKNEGTNESFEAFQLALTSDQAQFFAKIKSRRNLIITLDFKPSLKDNKIILDVKKFKVGDLPLPAFIGGFLVENIATKTLNTLLTAAGKSGKIEQITLADHKLNIRLLISEFK